VRPRRPRLRPKICVADMKFASDISGPIHAISFEFHVFVYDLIAKRKLIIKTFVYHTPPPETGAYYFQAERERNLFRYIR